MVEQKNNPAVQQKPLEQPVDVDQPGVDSVTEDINRFKKFFKQLTGGVNKTAKPVASKVQQKVAEKTPLAVKEKIPKKGGFGWAKLLFIPVFVLVLAVVMFSLVKDTPENGEEPEDPVPTEAVTEPTPTLEPFHPVGPSVYVDDPVIQKLQEDLNVINNEMFSIPLRDSTINPPVLDFNINFGDR